MGVVTQGLTFVLPGLPTFLSVAVFLLILFEVQTGLLALGSVMVAPLVVMPIGL